MSFGRYYADGAKCVRFVMATSTLSVVTLRVAAVCLRPLTPNSTAKESEALHILKGCDQQKSPGPENGIAFSHWTASEEAYSTTNTAPHGTIALYLSGLLSGGIHNADSTALVAHSPWKTKRPHTKNFHMKLAKLHRLLISLAVKSSMSRVTVRPSL